MEEITTDHALELKKLQLIILNCRDFDWPYSQPSEISIDRILRHKFRLTTRSIEIQKSKVNRNFHDWERGQLKLPIKGQSKFL